MLEETLGGWALSAWWPPTPRRGRGTGAQGAGNRCAQGACVRTFSLKRKARMAAESSAKKMIRMNRKNCGERGRALSPGGGRRGGAAHGRPLRSVTQLVQPADFVQPRDFAAAKQALFIMSTSAIRLGGQRGCNANTEKVKGQNKPPLHRAPLSRGRLWPGRPGGDGGGCGVLAPPPLPAAASAPHGRWGGDTDPQPQ